MYRRAKTNRRTGNQKKNEQWRFLYCWPSLWAWRWIVNFNSKISNWNYSDHEIILIAFLINNNLTAVFLSFFSNRWSNRAYNTISTWTALIKNAEHIRQRRIRSAHMRAHTHTHMPSELTLRRLSKYFLIRR